MTYLLKHKEVKRNHYGKLAKTAAAAIALALIFYFWGGALAPFFIKTLSPIPIFFKKAATNLELATKLLEPEFSLVSKNQMLEKKISELEKKTFDYEIMKGENAWLKEKLGLTVPGFVTANILLAPPQTPYDSILIARGGKKGIFVGAKVFSSEKSVLGFVEEVYDSSGRVRMYSSAGLKTSAKLKKNGALVELLGMGGGNFFFEAPLGFDIEAGDIFLMPGAEESVLAIVGTVRRHETSSFVSVLLKAPVKISGHSTLLVQIK